MRQNIIDNIVSFNFNIMFETYDTQWKRYSENNGFVKRSE